MCHPHAHSYVWLWMGSFRRWQRRFLVASAEAPGVVMIYKRMTMMGKVGGEQDASMCVAQRMRSRGGGRD